MKRFFLLFNDVDESHSASPEIEVGQLISHLGVNFPACSGSDWSAST